MQCYIPITVDALSPDALREFVPARALDGLTMESLTRGIPPTGLRDLPNTDTFTSVMSVDLAAAVGIPLYGSVDAKFSRRIYIQEFLRFVDDESSTPKKRYAVGVRWVVNVKILNASVKISSLPFISASAQVGDVEASARFQIIGLNSAKINQAIPVPADLNVETYVVMQDAFKKIKDLVDDAGTIVTPQVVAIWTEVADHSPQAYETALATCWALSKIDENKSLQTAMDESPQNSFFFNDAMKSVYIDIAKTSDLLTKPSAEARTLAHDRLLGFRLRR